ncbi:unnamed protein product (macronuclear) [Paramecium tetraurelia]|uniref:V-type proton ATPase subunit a n=1 Tax=Paramecium tetraurelia TaxID=5888 RepID=Q3SDC9_PARTE|nr:uncharacterized protein GSPATT00018094001 [Paramecium tetraurelia]CAI43257.1 V-ATPase a subunit 3_1 isotype of the V0 sector [Paramecium tetraurelia]CAK83777.1 unnamed protein product [Paramecium tetraurelia]|eukprot:XP_001451174.1 hypothetical protein (macronuclear) [Paramecium tetraurelia strain d4-2]
MSLFRSEQMEFYNLVIPRESAWDVMNTLGYFDSVHIIDYDPTLPQINRPFSNYVKRCDDVMQKIEQIDGEMRNFKIEKRYSPDVIDLLKKRNGTHKQFEELEQDICKVADDLEHQQQTMNSLQEKKNTIRENLEVLRNAVAFQNEDSEEASLLGFQKMVGVILKEDEMRFKRIIFRITKGNIHVDIMDIQEHFIQQDRRIVQKCVFMLIYPNGDLTQKKIQRVIESFSCNKFDIPTSSDQHAQRITMLENQLNEADQLLHLTITQINKRLQDLAEVKYNCSWIEEMRILVTKEKYLYMNLNMLNMTNSVFHGQIWLPQGQDQKIQQALRNLHGNDKQLPSGQIQECQTQLTPPTYYKLNSFTYPFQEIVNTYGIPRYKEINPGLSTIITFPFLVGVMFGDIGHGLLLFVCGLYLTTEDARKSIFSGIVPMRYMILLIGFFACYNGLIYNDFLSIGLNLFGSCYNLVDGEYELQEDCVYKFGIDPAWGSSANQLTFMNSFKMKLAVIIGVTHMTFGIILKGFNTLHFKSYMDFFCEFIPQFLLLLCSFGYMDFLLFLKWSTKFEDTKDAPSVITTMIDMVLRPFDVPEKPLFESGEQQRFIQLLLLTIITFCIPVMLITKPLLFSLKKKNPHQYQQIPSYVPDEDPNPEQLQNDMQKEQSQPHSKVSVQQHNEHDDIGELIVHQSIETIEFVLGSVSNTASYLRLWALSLAHSQLAEVFFSMTIASHIGDGGFFGTLGSIVQFPGFALATFGVLMCMDLMECFLHALRLQWVEFQSKFYKADGYLFKAYSFTNIKSNEQDD